MANSGYVYLSQYLRMRVETTLVRQSTVDNCSVIKAKVYLGRSNSGYRTTYTWNVSANVNGVNVVNTTWKDTVTGPDITVCETGEITIPHNNDGTKSFYTSFSLNCSKYNGAAGVTTVLPTIPRASSFSLDKNRIVLNGATEFNINISRHSNNFTHKVEIRFGNYKKEIGTGIATSTKYKPSANDINNFLQQIPNNVEGYGSIDVYTMQGNSQIGNMVSKTIYLEVDQSQNRPTIDNNLTIKKWLTTKKDLNENAIEQQELIQNLGYLTIGATGIGTKGHSTLSKVELSYGNTKVDVTNMVTNGNINYQTPVITASGNIYIQVLVTDSRGLRTSSTVELVNSVAYTLPTITKFSAFRCGENENGDGTFDENDEAFYIATDIVAQYSRITYMNTNGNSATNELNFLLSRKQANWDKYYSSCASFGTEEKQLEGTRYEKTVSQRRVPNSSKVGWTKHDNNDADVYFFDTDVPYTLELKVYDSLGGIATSYIEISTASTILDLYQDGTGLAIGKVAQGEGLEIDWDTRINKTLTVGGKQIVTYEETTHSINGMFSGNQTVRKYSDGRMEIEYLCTATIDINTLVWGSWYSSNQITTPSFATPFKEIPTTIKSVTSSVGCFSIYRDPTVANPGTIEVLRPQSGNTSSGEFTLHIIAKGKYQ